MPCASGVLLKTQSDSRLCQLTSEGHEAAFEALVERYRSPLHRFARRLLTDAPAEDVVQQALTDLWATLSAGEPIHNVRAWLYRVVRNAALNTIRRAGYRHDELGDALAPDSPELAFERKSQVRDALAGLASLPATQREAIVRSAVHGDSRTAIGTAMGLNDGAVGQLLYRARSALRCAMSAIVPLPVLAWLTRFRVHHPASAARTLQITAAGTNSGAGAIIIRGSATLAVIAAAAAPVLSTQAARPHVDRGAVRSAALVSADRLSAGASDPLSAFPRAAARSAAARAAWPAAATPNVSPHPSAPASADQAPAAVGGEDSSKPAGEVPAGETAPAEASSASAEPSPQPVPAESAPASEAAPAEAPAEAPTPPAGEAGSTEATPPPASETGLPE
jgi:RNA polymerase sigma factor (sigma-70 family)